MHYPSQELGRKLNPKETRCTVLYSRIDKPPSQTSPNTYLLELKSPYINISNTQIRTSEKPTSHFHHVSISLSKAKHETLNPIQPNPTQPKIPTYIHLYSHSPLRAASPPASLPSPPHKKHHPSRSKQPQTQTDALPSNSPSPPSSIHPSLLHPFSHPLHSTP